MKICKKCDLPKDESEFSKRSASKDGLNSWCKLCFKDYERDRYQNGDRARKEKNREASKQRGQNFIWSILEKSSCAVCNEDDPLMLQFHHLDQDTKKYNVVEMTSYGINLIKEEIDKCVILCANHHQKETATQSKTWRYNKSQGIV